MIRLKDISKQYVSKSKQKVDALKDVSFDLGNKGMVFILGKSGSGKSTLLNILGGLDKPSSGEMTVDGRSVSDFNQKDYDGYRNGYVGFIFQEYNLLDDFNVKENIELALKLSHEETANKVVKALKDVELTEDYLTRRVSELSGGEKQRVAIARCLVKDSKMILADEPTGNLDSATGESIWKILKKLSETKLVVAVTHDRESAEKYADRILEISDGRVQSVFGAQEESQEGTYQSKARRLPFKTCMRMAWNSLFIRKGKAIGVIAVSFFTILVLLITEMCATFSVPTTVAKYIRKYDVPYFEIVQTEYDEEHKQYIDVNSMHGDALNYVSDHSVCISNVTTEEQITDMGLEFYGNHQPLDENTFYVSKYYLERDFGNIFIFQNGEYTQMTLKDIDGIVGKQAVLDNFLTSRNGNVPVCGGIVDTDKVAEASRTAIPYYFVSKDFHCLDLGDFVNVNYDLPNTDSPNLTGSGDITVSDKTTNGAFRLGGDKYDTFWNGQENSSSLGDSNNGMLTSAGYKLFSDTNLATPLKKDEFVLSFEMYRDLFGGPDRSAYVDNSCEQWTGKVVEEIGKTFSVKINFNGKQIDLGERKLTGITFSSDSENNVKTVYIDEQTSYDLKMSLLTPASVMVKADSVGSLERLLNKLHNKYKVKTKNAGEYFMFDDEGQEIGMFKTVNFVESFGNFLNIFTIVFAVISAIMLIILVLMLINLISFSIASRKREIGILSALGTSNRDIVVMFLLEALIIAVVCFVLVLVTYIVFISIFNVIYSDGAPTGIVVPLFNLNVITLLTLVVSSFGLLTLSAWIPASKIAKLKPIDAIRN